MTKRHRYFIAPAALVAAGVLVHPEAARQGAALALSFWWQALVPALFPFLLAAEFLTATLPARASFRGHRFWPYTAALLAGAPAAAVLAARWHRSGRMTTNQASKLMAIASLPGPAYLEAAVAGPLLHAPAIGPLLLAVQYAAALPAAVFLLTRRQPNAEFAQPASFAVPSVDRLAESLSAVIQGLALVGAAAAVAGALSGAVAPYFAGPRLWPPLAFGLGDVDVGLHALAGLALPLPLTSGLAAALVALGGLPLWMETAVFAASARLKLGPFAACRIIQAALAAPLTAVAVYILAPGADARALPVIAWPSAATATPAPLLAAGFVLAFVIARRITSSGWRRPTARPPHGPYHGEVPGGFPPPPG